MKMDVRTSVALCLLVVATTAAAQSPTPEQTVPAPQQSAPAPPAPSPPAAPAQNAPPPPPAQQAQPATPPLPRLPSQQYQYTPPPPSPPPPQYKYQYTPPPQPQSSAPPPASPKPQWTRYESSYPARFTGFQYHPFVFHIDGGGTITQRSNNTLLDNGWNAGLGLTWYPTRHLPLGIRIDGTYNEFDDRPPLLDQAAMTYGTRVDNGTQKMWGGDVDLQLDLPLSPYVRMYLLAGGGWYKIQQTFRQTNFYKGYFCDWWGCGPGYVGVNGIVARNTSDWTFAKNAGLGFEFALAPRTSFFIEARYMRLNPNDAKSDFIPVRAGFRF